MKKIVILLMVAVLATACGPDASIPTESTPKKEAAQIYPDYRDVTIPPNIAPLNIMVKEQGEEFVGVIEGMRGSIITAAGEDGKLMFDETEWHDLLESHKGSDLKVTIYAKNEGTWYSYPTYSISVAEEPIDQYLSYRLIEPSYELYRQLGLYQRDLTTFEEYPIYENNREYDDSANHCVNCHNYQNYGTDRMLFHVRARHGGTVFVDKGNVKKMTMTNENVLSNCVYPSWHPNPTRNWVIFSSNLTGQSFHMRDLQKIEVLDYGSDLVFYDADKGTLTNIIKTANDMETFPCWAPDGKKIYYCVAKVPKFEALPDSLKNNNEKKIDIVSSGFDSIHYNIMSMTFDEQTRTFGEPQMEVDCASMGKSATVPRVSPDGRYLLFTLGDFGQFHIWHTNSDQWVKDLQTGEVYELKAANSPSVDSYHTWSSNGRWIVFSSRREDNNFTRPAIAYFDKNGQAHKAFILPQEDPEYHVLFFKSYNVPELTKTKVQITPEQFKEVIYADDKAGKVTYLKGAHEHGDKSGTDGTTSASKVDGRTSASKPVKDSTIKK